MKKEIAILPSLNTMKLLETVHGRNHHTNKLLIWKISFERYFLWNYCFFLLFDQTYLSTSYQCFHDPAVKPPWKKVHWNKPTEKSYLKLDNPAALLSFTVIQSLNFRIPQKCFLEKFTVWKCNKKFWTSWKQQQQGYQSYFETLNVFFCLDGSFASFTISI